MKLISGLCLSVACGVAQAEWVQYGSTKGGPSYYDPSNVIELPDGNTSVWVKFHMSEEDVNEGKRLFPSFNNYDFSIKENIFDCPSQRIKLASTYSYDKSGETLFGHIYEPGEMEFIDILPGSITDELAKIICKKINN